MNRFTARTFTKSIIKTHALPTPSTSQPEIMMEPVPLRVSPNKADSLPIGVLNTSYDADEQSI